MAEVKATDVNSPKIVTGKNSNNKDAQDYSMKFFSGDTPDPIGKYTQPKEYKVDISSAGYPDTDVKTEGIEKRGVGAATKGTKARGPLA